jgi:hypothetical protein
MHNYAIDSNERITIPLYIAIMSILIGLLIQNTLNFYNIIVPWWIDAPSIFGLYAILYTFFDKHLWKSRLFKITGIVKTPNLNGSWKGALLSSYNDFKTPYEMTMKIIQTWTKISIVLEAESSSSCSTIAGIIAENPERMSLTYQYVNEPNEDAESTMQMHRGTATLEIQANGNMLVGGCYSNRARKTYGRLTFERNLQ